ncbi:epimerase [Tabrizicola flagellatus]|uniref:epimerase n=1 Tax=Tabrizicola flagellatus TaxID=2593021 RepID=UPI0011F12618|nr:epimerase [Tabrizicola flagellatus]
MTRTALVLGASGGFGGQVALALQRAGWTVNRYARGTDMTAAARGADLIVNGLNPPAYHDWDRLIPEITTSVLAAGRASGATLLVPGNVYPYGMEPGPWGPDTPHRPVARKGRIRAEMEARYRAAADRGQRTILLRGGDFLLPEAPQMVMNRVILGEVGKGRVTALGDPEALHAYAFLPDMARAAVALVALGEALPAYADIPFAGHAFTISDLAARITRLSGRPMRIKRFPRWIFTLASPVWELARELREMLYLFDHPHALDPAPLRRWLPDWQDTALDEVIARHLRARGLI